MRQFLREHYQLVAFILLWIFLAARVPWLLYGILPIGIFLLRRADRWQDILFSFIMVLVLSDMLRGLPGMRVMAGAKGVVALALGLVVLVDQVRMQPMARLFYIFLPFFAYAFFPIIWSEVPVTAFEKTLSYGLLFLVVPNFVLYNFRLHGWDFFKNLVWFLVLVLAAQPLLPIFWPAENFYVAERFTGFFGNPNGMAIFVYLTLVLFTVVNQLHRGLFSRTSVIFIYAVLAYYLITCGARTSLMSSLMFLVFIQFFRISLLLGIISFIAFIGLAELLSSNLPFVINALGLHEYMRVDTLADGSGRYIAWQYVWQQINEKGFFLFGGGFENEYVIMERAYPILSPLGHEGGAHNSYLTFWLNVGIVGLILYFRSFALIFIKAGKNTSLAMAVMFSVLFSVLYESWLTASLNPYTILLLVILTVMSEEEIIGSLSTDVEELEAKPVLVSNEPLILPAR
ncbi:MAG: O-antigen ligase family protein [Flavobacteriales bacterium]|nr:O-antigen ligase family protein [Flavobacteriales bacterium]